MTADSARIAFVLEGRDEASAAVRTLTESMKRLERQAQALGATLGGSIGAELSREFGKITAQAKALGSDLVETGEKTAKALRSDTAAARELSAALREVASAQDAVARAARGAAGGRSGSGGSSGGSNGNSRGRGQGAGGNDLRGIRDRWRIREASERAERREIETTAKATASAAAARARADEVALNRKLAGLRYGMQVRERSEAAEMRHLAGVRREHDALRRRASTAGRHAYSHARHAVRSINHPALESPGHAAALGAAFGLAAGHHIVEATVALDTATARYRMLAVPAGVDPSIASAEARKQALQDSISLGVDADKLLDIQTKAIRDGVSPEIARTLPRSVVAAAQTMGGDVEKLTDSLAEGLQEAFAMKWLKTPQDARKFLNIEAGLSNFAGNSATKTEQFIAAGGLGHGKEMGLGLVDTMAYGAMLNASGARTGQASARFMGQLSQNTPKMYDFYTSAVRSHKNSEEERAVKSAPARLGYGGIRDMQAKIMAGPEGVLDFAVRLEKLDEKTRKLVLQGYHFSEQGGAMLAELGANDGAKGKSIIARARELEKQKEAGDYLSTKFREWQTGLANMLAQSEKGWRAIETEIGDVLKVDLITPFRDWWVQLSRAIVGGNLRERVHGALMGFVHGLGFEDVATLLNTMSANARGFDVAGFAQGLGEGVRAVVDSFRSMAGIFGGAGGLDARTIGRLAAELFGFSIALHVMAPFVTLIGGMASGFLAVKAALEGAAMFARLTGLADGIKAVVGAEAAAAGAGLLSLAGGLTVIGVAIQGLLSAGILPKVTLLPKDTTAEGLDDWLWGKNKDGTSARPAWVDRLTGGGAKPGEGFTTGPHGGLVPLPQAYQGGGANWRDLLTPASYSSDDATIGDRDRDTAAMIGTSRAAQRIADRLDTLVPKLGMIGTASSLSTVAGFGGGGGEGGGRANMRYGRGAAGGWRSTPGTGSYGDPSKSLLDLIAQSEGAGYNVSWGNGKFLPGGHEQNLTGKSLNEILALGDTMRRQPGARNSSALGRYQITGSTLRDLMKRMGLNGSEKFDEAMQDRLASKLISDEGPRALNRWEGLKRGTYMSRAQALLRSGSIASQPGAASFNGGGAGGAGKAVDIAMGMQGAGERSAQSILGAYMHPGEWCADFVNGTLKRAGITGSGSAMAASFSRWGHHVDPGAVQKGDVITERHGNHVGHVGLATGNVQRDKAGNVTAVEMISGNYGHAVRKNWERIGIISDLRRSNEAVMDAARKVATPESLAGSAGAGRKGSSPAPHHHGPVGHAPMQTAQAAPVTIHAPIHIHGHQDPHHLAKVVEDRLASLQRNRFNDSMV